MKRYNYQIYQTGRYTKETETRMITQRPQWSVVNNRHKLMYHEDGHILVFPRKKDALAWLSINKKENWRAIKTNVCITTI